MFPIYYIMGLCIFVYVLYFDFCVCGCRMSICFCSCFKNIWNFIRHKNKPVNTDLTVDLLESSVNTPIDST